VKRQNSATQLVDARVPKSLKQRNSHQIKYTGQELPAYIVVGRVSAKLRVLCFSAHFISETPKQRDANS
jgi:hypothetical protein